MLSSGDQGLARLVDWAGLQLRLIWCYEGPVSHYGRHGVSGTDEMSVWLLRRGSVTLRSKGGPLTAQAGQWVVLQSGPVHRDFSDDADIISLRFQACWPDKRNIFEDGLPMSLRAEKYPQLQRRATALAHFVKRHFEKPDVTLPLSETTLLVYIQLQSLFEAWLAGFIASVMAEGLIHTRFGKIDERVRRGLFLIDRLPLDQPFVKRNIAQQLALSPSQMDRIFAREIGLTPNAYFEARRHDFARSALAESGTVVKAVACSLGFQSASHFSTWFRRLTGQSPREFIHAARKGNVLFPQDNRYTNSEPEA
ncbi:MAG TPA: AraC family transcriptional regulator [Opitutaceae bacterium]